MNVCDYILYHLIVVKQPATTGEEMQVLDRQTDYFEPPEVVIRQNQELISSQKAEIEQLQKELMLNHYEMEKLKGALAAQGKELRLYKQKTNELLLKLEGFRQNKAYQLLWPLLNRSNAWPMLPESFQGMKADARTMFGPVEKFLLQPGVNLNSVDFLEYPVKLLRPNLVEIHLAVVLDLPLSKGGLGIELVSPQNKIVLQKVVQAEALHEDQPVVFEFLPVAETGQGEFRLRVFAKAADAPVRVFEFHQPRPFRLGRSRAFPFIGLRFQEN